MAITTSCGREIHILIMTLLWSDRPFQWSRGGPRLFTVCPSKWGTLVSSPRPSPDNCKLQKVLSEKAKQDQVILFPLIKPLKWQNSFLVACFGISEVPGGNKVTCSCCSRGHLEIARLNSSLKCFQCSQVRPMDSVWPWEAWLLWQLSSAMTAQSCHSVNLRYYIGSTHLSWKQINNSRNYSGRSN